MQQIFKKKINKIKKKLKIAICSFNEWISLENAFS